jgi:hypothetical protein
VVEILPPAEDRVVEGAIGDVSLEGVSRSFLKKKVLVDALSEEMKVDRDKLMAFLDDLGEEDTNGSLAVSFPVPIEGYVGIQKQRRVSRKLVSFDVVKARLAALGLDSRVVKTVTTDVIDEEELLQAHWEGLISEDDLDALYPASVTWALTPQKPRAPKKR